MTSRGKPIEDESSRSLDEGSVGTSASCAIFFAVILSPIDSMASDEGPIQIMPSSVTAFANDAFSDKNPYPGCIASEPVLLAASMISF